MTAQARFAISPGMTPPLVQLRAIAAGFGGKPLLDGVDLIIGQGERLALVGRNGSGKSTLLRIAAGLVEPDAGVRFVDPGITVRYLPQEPDPSGFPTVLAYVEAGLGPGDDRHRAISLLQGLGLAGDEPTSHLSGGEARRAALARVLAPRPDVLLLDEPTNHLDLPAIEWLEAELAAFSSALVVISHDRRFLTRLSNAVVWLDRGRARRLERGFAAFEPWRDEVLAQEELDRHKLDRQIAREEDWLRYGVTARRKRNQGRLAGLHALKAERGAQRQATGAPGMAASDAQASGTRVVEARRLAKSYDGLPIVRDFSTRILRGDRVAIVGPNGAGKTTLLSLLTGRLRPDAGEAIIGANVGAAWLDQQRATLDPERTVADTVTGGGSDTLTVAGRPVHVASYLKTFLFAPEQARQKVKLLSGGERGRLLLAALFARPSNLLVLDEPTNDLDVETLDVLQEALAEYGGTVLMVSHDRDFIDRVATLTVMAEGDGRFTAYAGGYSDMVAQRGEGVSMAMQETSPRRTRSGSVTAAPIQSVKRRLSFKEKHALETLPGRIEQLAAAVATMEQDLSDPALYSRDPQGFAALTGKLHTSRTALASAEDEWLALEMLRESLAG